MLRPGIAWLRLSLCCDLATDLSRSSEGPGGRERGADDAASVVVVVGWEGRGGGGVEGCWPVFIDSRFVWAERFVEGACSNFPRRFDASKVHSPIRSFAHHFLIGLLLQPAGIS